MRGDFVFQVKAFTSLSGFGDTLDVNLKVVRLFRDWVCGLRNIAQKKE